MMNKITLYLGIVMAAVAAWLASIKLAQKKAVDQVKTKMDIKNKEKEVNVADKVSKYDTDGKSTDEKMDSGEF